MGGLLWAIQGWWLLEGEQGLHFWPAMALLVLLSCREGLELLSRAKRLMLAES